jgi:DNA replication protein DnaC
MTIVTCEICDGTGWKSIDAGGVRRVERCDCWREKASTKALMDAGIPPNYKRCDLDNFRDYNDSLVRAVSRAKAFAESFPVVDKGLLFLGPSGLGKTHLAVATLKRVVTRCGARALFRPMGALLRQIRDTYNPVVRSTERQVIQPVIDAELLVLDDLGRERPTDWVEETLTLIIDTRYNERRPTIITSNYGLMDDSTEPNALISRIGFRTMSRLHEMCEFVQMSGVDYRELGPNATAEAIAALEKKGSRAHAPQPKKGMVKAQLKAPARELGWAGGKAGS